MNGILVLDKPAGKSSHAVITAVRDITGERRAGHAGTLDPMATGVLVVLLGAAVRLSEYLVGHDKRYRATIRLGIETDTYDSTGRVVASSSVQVSESELQAALDSLVGKQLQVPPAHSAIQKAGVRAYKLARQGIAVSLEPRAVEIHSIQILDFDGDEVILDVHCSKGTFIRSLAHDLGVRLGTGAHLSALRRLASGPFALEQSVTLEELARITANGELDRHLLPMDRAVLDLDAVYLDEADARAVRTGRKIPMPRDLTTDVVRAYDDKGAFFAILKPAGDRQLKPVKVLDAA